MSDARRRVVLTGAAGTLDGLGAVLADAGLTCEDRPLLGFGPPETWLPLDTAIARIRHYAAIAITSPRAAEALVERTAAVGLDPASAPPVWCGAASASLLRSVFPDVQVPMGALTAPASLAVRLASAMLSAGVGSPVLFPCGEIHREELLVRLRAAGRRVDAVITYRATLAPMDEMTAAIDEADIMVVTSPRVAQQLAAVPTTARPSMVAIGPTTAEAAAAAGWTPDAVAMRPAVADVAGAIHALLPSLT